MKNPVAYYLLLLYITALCRPIMPLIQDVIAHTFYEHEHVATVHRDGGKSHVATEIGKMTKEDDCNKSTSASKIYEEIPLHLSASINCYLNFYRAPSAIVHNSIYVFHLPAFIQAIQAPPPRV